MYTVEPECPDHLECLAHGKYPETSHEDETCGKAERSGGRGLPVPERQHQEGCRRRSYSMADAVITRSPKIHRGQM